MGSVIFDFLTDSLLFDEKRLASGFADVKLRDLQAELDRYRAFCIQNYGTLRHEIGSDPKKLNIFFDDSPMSFPFDRAALYADKCVIEDPLCARSSPEQSSKKAFNRALGAVDDDEYEKKAVAKAAKQMKANTALVAADFLKYFPTSLSFEGPAEIPLVASDNGFEDVLPEKLLLRLKEAADVTSMETLGQGRFRTLKKGTACRAISIEFDPFAPRQNYGYMLFDSKFHVVDEERQLVRASMNPRSDPPDLDNYRAWVKQSVNQAAKQFYTRNLFAAQLASSLNCVYSTRSDLLFSVLPRTASTQTAMVSKNAELFMNLETPFLEGLTAEEIVRLRRDEGEAFANFRITVDSRLRALQEIDDLEKANRLAKQAVHELANGGSHELKNKLRSIQEKFAWSAVLMTAGLLGSVQTGGLSLLGTLSGSKGVVDTVLEYRKEVKRHPAYFLWKFQRKKR